MIERVDPQAFTGNEDRNIIGCSLDFGTPVAFDVWQLVEEPHALILGASGSGKSYALRKMLEIASDEGLPFLMFDIANEFHTLKEHVTDPARVRPSGEYPLVRKPAGPAPCYHSLALGTFVSPILRLAAP